MSDATSAELAAEASEHERLLAGSQTATQSRVSSALSRGLFENLTGRNVEVEEISPEAAAHAVTAMDQLNRAELRRARMSPFCLATVDNWAQRFARRLVLNGIGQGELRLNRGNTPALAKFLKEIEAEEENNTDADINESMADFLSLAFEVMPVYRDVDERKSVHRSKYLETFSLDSPKIMELRQSSTGDLFATSLVAESLLDGYDGYLEQLSRDPSATPGRYAVRAIRKATSVGGSGFGGGCPGYAQGVPVPQTDQEMDRVIKLMISIRKDPVLRKILYLSGRFKNLCVSIQSQKTMYCPEELTDIDNGTELAHMLSNEFAKLADPVSRTLLLAQLIDRSYLGRSPKKFVSQVRGPIVIAIDESGSMKGTSQRTKNTRIEEAKSMGLALADLAQRQGRWCGLLSWSGQSQTRSWLIPPSSRDHIVSLTEFACNFFNGGTVLPLPEVRKIIDVQCKEGIKPDVVIITDGEVNVDQHVLDDFIDWRRKNQVRVFGLALACKSEYLEKASTDYYPLPDLSFEEKAVHEVLRI